MRFFGILALSCVMALQLAFAGEFYVSEHTGDNTNDGSKEKPFKNLETALKAAKAGDTIRVATGNYFGLRGKGFLEVPVPVEIYGGYNAEFSEREILKHRTLIQPSNESAGVNRNPMMTFLKSDAGSKIVIDGLIFEMGQRNSYSSSEGKPEGCETGMLLLPPAFNKEKGDKPTVEKPILYFPPTGATGDVIVRNCVFANGGNYAIQGGHKSGTFQILNNVFVSNRMAAIEIYGTGGKKGPRGPTEKDGEVEIAYNTILFSWSRLKDFQDMGYGIRIMTQVGYNIHHNIIACNALTGIDHTRFNLNDWVKIENNVLALNKQADLLFSENTQGRSERVQLKDFGDLGLAGAKGNTDKLPSNFPIDKAYLDGFLSARYTEEADFDPNSPANVLREVMGLPKQGKLTTTVSMFGNRYPLEDALKLFGAGEGVGAQLPK